MSRKRVPCRRHARAARPEDRGLGGDGTATAQAAGDSSATSAHPVAGHRSGQGEQAGAGVHLRQGHTLGASQREPRFRRAGVRPIRLYDLRHSCATLLFAQGVDVATVQRILRHASITTTTTFYLEVIERVQREAVAGMDGLFGGDT
ncbi:tyrosine-type recombinase/integrase [Nocardia otitidiscaviarum]|uniref:tyrosine-type recombinase/integrase n=1 Tax=Nocardia otitidiscaviarum TaxID=1823 RepID=UPI002B4AED03|nr:tyrosine-type recombinase/integrase [Nocardia otitidiscaviarum]